MHKDQSIDDLVYESKVESDKTMNINDSKAFEIMREQIASLRKQNSSLKKENS